MGVIMLLVAHFLGDFILQSSKMAHEKMESLKFFFIHCFIYAGVILLALVNFGPIKNVVWIFIAITVSHAIIDFCRIKIMNKAAKRKTDNNSVDFVAFLIDQILHILVILVCGFFIKENSVIGNTLRDILLTHFEGKQLHNILVYILLYSICLTPAAVFIRKVFVFFSIQKDTETEDKKEMVNSGYLIGILERIIILTLGLNGQLGTIGFVLAAKSLARFKQLEDQNFAEKYLVGTLLSVAISLLCITWGNSILIK
jgi:hypothetical protein